MKFFIISRKKNLNTEDKYMKEIYKITCQATGQIYIGKTEVDI